MNTGLSTDPTAPVAIPRTTNTRPLYWSVRRELWENRSLYLAPLAVVGLLLLGYLFSAIHYWENFGKIIRATLSTDPLRQAAMIGEPHAYVAILLHLTAFIVGVFYCLDALHGERRDRSILFWKSLPVSDFTTVLSKAAIPLVILPLVTFVIIIATQLILLLSSSVMLLAHGFSANTLWSPLPVFQNALVLLYGLISLTLWHAPLYGWLLLISGFANRSPFLWALLPPIALSIIEWIAFRTSHVASMLSERLMHSSAQIIVFKTLDGEGKKTWPVFTALTELDPWTFLSTPGLWIGVLLAAAFLFAAARLRRQRESI